MRRRAVPGGENVPARISTVPVVTLSPRKETLPLSIAYLWHARPADQNPAHHPAAACAAFRGGGMDGSVGFSAPAKARVHGGYGARCGRDFRANRGAPRGLQRNGAGWRNAARMESARGKGTERVVARSGSPAHRSDGNRAAGVSPAGNYIF